MQMNNGWIKMAVVVLGFSSIGCAGSLNSIQKGELQSFQAKGMLVEEKKPGLAAGLGILPGGGSFYTRHIGLGVVNLLLWPLSILWDPVSGYDGAQYINYFTTKAYVARQRDKELQELDEQMLIKKISSEEYLLKKRAIERKYSGEIQ